MVHRPRASRARQWGHMSTDFDMCQQTRGFRCGNVGVVEGKLAPRRAISSTFNNIKRRQTNGDEA